MLLNCRDNRKIKEITSNKQGRGEASPHPNTLHLFKNFASLLAPYPSHIYNLTGSSAALFLALQERPFIVVESTEESARELWKDILFFRTIVGADPCVCPDRVSSNVYFLPEPNGPEIAGERAGVVYHFKEGDSIVTSKNAMSVDVWLPQELKENILRLNIRLEIGRDLVEQRLNGLGYKKVSIVVDKGEYSQRGWLLDIFPSTSENPVRVEFFGDEIETIRTFDIDTQKSTSAVEDFLILPASEPPASGGCNLLSIIDNVNYFLFDSIHQEGIPEGAISLSRFAFEGAGVDAGLLSMKGYGIYPEERKSIDKLAEVIGKMSWDNRTVIVSSSRGQAERLKEVLMDGGVIAPVIPPERLVEYEGQVSITVGGLSSGLFLPGLLILTEKEIFGGRPAFRPIKRSRVSKLLTTIDDLNTGDFIVHRDHGIGRFIGLVRQKIGDYEGDLMTIEYAGGDRLHLPLQGINRIQKYYSGEGVTPRIDTLGGKTWQRTKEKVRKRIKEMAEKLLNLYAEREVSKGFSFSPDTELHREFDGFFPYEETPDQLKAIEEIKADMESERPMDKLLCGDVGYGKTEVAMRAAFKAVYDGKQVAVIVPTTLLCEQHYRTFKSRFSAFPVSIDYLSRFKSSKEQVETIKAIAMGDVDIVIGTHSLLRKDISFRNIGLLIVDEEHRFGVVQKEKIKEFKKGIDVLSLTATPIPRTLHMALSGIRNMSVIETPPEERLAVRSIVSVFNDGLIREAIVRELGRGGQVFFVHNRIRDIGRVGDYLRGLVPDARIAIAHGQMTEKELERIMLRFINREIDVLVSTAIIGSGLDIPTANTIIINRADRMGLADLYQLKGRVGRSDVRAYAYLLIPGEDIVTDEAKKRLQAIHEMSYLGAGFRVAMKDLEIRGAGNLLGPEQSGHIYAVGFDMYAEMLEKAVAELRGLEIAEEFEPSISLKVSALIPEDYVDDMTLRLSIYRRIASAKSFSEIENIEAEMRDRFGRLPVEVKNLLDIMRLKIMARGLLIANIQEIKGNVRVIFAKDTKVSVEKILGLQKIMDGRIRFLQEGFELDIKGLPWNTVYEEIQKLFSLLV